MKVEGKVIVCPKTSKMAEKGESAVPTSTNEGQIVKKRRIVPEKVAEPGTSRQSEEKQSEVVEVEQQEEYGYEGDTEIESEFSMNEDQEAEAVEALPRDERLEYFLLRSRNEREEKKKGRFTSLSKKIQQAMKARYPPMPDVVAARVVREDDPEKQEEQDPKYVAAVRAKHSKTGAKKFPKSKKVVLQIDPDSDSDVVEIGEERLRWRRRRSKE